MSLSLKISSLCTELRGQDWQALGSQLNVPGATLSRIHQEYLSDPRRCMAEMFDSWLKQGEDVSWNQVAVALRNLHQMDLATRLIRKYCTGTETDRGEGGAGDKPELPVIHVHVAPEVQEKLVTLKLQYGEMIAEMREILLKHLQRNYFKKTRRMHHFITSLAVILEKDIHKYRSFDEIYDELVREIDMFQIRLFKEVVTFHLPPHRSQPCIRVYEHRLNAFKSSTTIEEFKQAVQGRLPQVLNKSQYDHLTLKLDEEWSKCTLKALDVLIYKVFGVHKNVFVDPIVTAGCIEVQWKFRDYFKPILVNQALSKLDLLAESNIIGLWIGDEVIFSLEQSVTLLKLTETVKENWETGIQIQSGYMKPFHSDEYYKPVSGPPSRPVQKAKVVFNCEAEQEDEVTVKKGDIIDILEKETGEDGWWKIRCGDKEGLVPNNFLELIAEEVTPSTPSPVKSYNNVSQEITQTTQRDIQQVNSSLKETQQTLQDHQQEMRLQETQDQLRETQAQLRETQAQLQEAQAQLQDARTQLQVTQAKLQETEYHFEESQAPLQVQLMETQNQLEEILSHSQVEIQELNQIIIERDQQLHETTQRKQHEIDHLQTQIQNPWVIQKEEIIMTQEILGTGGWGEVKVGIFRGIKVAVKCLHQVILSEYNLSLFSREMNIASRIRHPNLLQFIGATKVGNPMILTELMPTSLRKELEKSPMTQTQIITIARDVASALNYLHLWKPDPILHRDVSSANVLLESSGSSRWKGKLSDYGSANVLHQIRTVAPGSPAYAAPEAQSPKLHSPKMDVYSFGVLFVEMVSRRLPSTLVFEREEQIQGIQWSSIRALVERCTSRDPQTRPTIDKVLHDINTL